MIERVPHNFGRVPIVRLIDLKKHRTPTVGKSRYEAIAELQREFYNRDSRADPFRHAASSSVPLRGRRLLQG